MQKGIFCFCAFAVILLAGCGFEAPEPRRTAPPTTPQPPLSTIAVTLDVPVSDLAAMLNQKTSEQITREEGKKTSCFIAKCKTDLVATRTGPILAAAKGGGISLDLPFSVMAHVSMKGGFFKSGGDADAQGHAHAFTTLALTSDWQVRTHTTGSVQLSDSHLKLGPIETSVTDLWNHNDEHLSDAIFREFDRRIGPAIKLKPQAEKLWARVQQPIQVGKKPTAWLLLKAQALRVGNVQTENDRLMISFAADVRGKVIVGEKPEIPAQLQPLPKPQPMRTSSNGFEFTIPVTLPYPEAAQLALAQIRKRPPHIGGTQIEIDKLDILPSGQDVIVAIHFCVAQSWDVFGWFDSCGDGYLRGTPIFDAATNDVRIANVHYDVGTQDMILSAMRWLAGDELIKQIQQHLVFNVAHDIEKLETSITKALSKPQGKDVVISGQVESFGPPTLGWTDQGFLAVFTAKGTVHASLNLQKH